MGWRLWWIDLMLKNTCWLKLLSNKQTVKNNNIQILYCLQRTREEKSINYMWQTVSSKLFYSRAYASLAWLPNVLCIHINPTEINRNSSCPTLLKTQMTRIWNTASSTERDFQQGAGIPCPFHEFTVNISDNALASLQWTVWVFFLIYHLKLTNTHKCKSTVLNMKHIPQHRLEKHGSGMRTRFATGLRGTALEQREEGSSALTNTPQKQLKGLKRR